MLYYNDFCIKHFYEIGGRLDSFINTKTLAVGGGKGGVGKSFIASNLACSIALQGHKVVLIDADLAGSNIHTMIS